jgi:hypothetical protein
MDRHRILTFVTFAVAGLCANFAYAYPDELFNIAENPTSGSANPPNEAMNGTSATIGIKISETSGPSDTINITYYAWDQGNSDAPLPCDPSSDGPFPISKTAPVTDSCTINGAGATGPILFEACVTGNKYGGNQNYYQTLTAWGSGSKAHSHTLWSPTVRFSPLKDYLVPVNVTLQQGAGLKVKMRYSATITSGTQTTPVACTPASETIIVSKEQTITHYVLMHCYGLSGDVAFTASGTPQGLGSKQDTKHYAVPATVEAACSDKSPKKKDTAHKSMHKQKVTSLPKTILKSPSTSAKSTFPAAPPPSGFDLKCDPISATNQYVASVFFPVEPKETHIKAYYQAHYPAPDGSPIPVDAEPVTSDSNVGPDFPKTRDVLLDCTNLANTCVTFHVGGEAAHSKSFTVETKFVPQSQ